MAADNLYDVVIDNGSFTTKCGFSGEDAPRAVFPTVIGKPRIITPMMGMGLVYKDLYVGEEAEAKRDVLSLSRPLEKGIIVNMDDMTSIWEHTLRTELRIEHESHRVLLTQKALTLESVKASTLQVMFERIHVKACCIETQSVLSLLSAGRTTGLVLDAGYASTCTVPVVDNAALKQAVCMLDVGGRELDLYWMQLMRDKGVTFTSCTDWAIMRDMKEKMGYISRNLESAMNNDLDAMRTVYELPDGQKLKFDDIRFQCPEALFKPQRIAGDNDASGGLTGMLLESVAKCGVRDDGGSLGEQLLGNIVLSGGTSMFAGFKERLYDGLTMTIGPIVPHKHLVNGFMRSYGQRVYGDVVDVACGYLDVDEASTVYAGRDRVGIIALPERKYVTWIGGSILASLSTFEERWITKEQYEESGLSMVQRKLL